MQNGAKYLHPISLASLSLSSSHSQHVCFSHSALTLASGSQKVGAARSERHRRPATLSPIGSARPGARRSAREQAALRPARREWSGGAAAACVRRPAMAGKAHARARAAGDPSMAKPFPPTRVSSRLSVSGNGPKASPRETAEVVDSRFCFGNHN